MYSLAACWLWWAGWPERGWRGALPPCALAALPVVAINTLLSASGAIAATFAVTASASASPTPASAPTDGSPAWSLHRLCRPGHAGPRLVCRGVAGIVTPLMVELLELALSIDDPSGAVTVHAVGGLWGLLAAGLFAPLRANSSPNWWVIATLLAWYCGGLPAFLAAQPHSPLPRGPDGERIGMDLHELGGGAYPDFVIHRDESYR